MKLLKQCLYLSFYSIKCAGQHVCCGVASSFYNILYCNYQCNSQPCH